MRNTLIFIGLLCYSIVGFSQEEETLDFFKTDSTWFKEIIKFPIKFAQNIKFEGIANLRFPPGWAKQESPEFWSYMWAWSLNDVEHLTEHELETNIQLYFDGLLGLDFYKIDDKKTPKTNAIFIKKNNSYYVGKVKTTDTRFTKKQMTLNVLVEQQYYKKENKSILVFRFSPKPFNNAVWTTLKSVKLKDDVCRGQS